ncbi:Vegetative incompatibility protein HET-E-1 [Gnomoniopsis smithogilvyi]|uniref:Vegetative incompatibility protein HET-E-1 n=1 Tax=Gnomoniopsis smithogilvyi TaxID=1191159 RepID=A0A9W9CTZ2_9PEZI|nr:Vegetative incompatibility protein HET-E-1 [Gnomoniopsis smithogilvyi]
MRLLERSDDGIRLTKDLNESTLPRYAILSHTWGPDTEEVSFQDMVDGTGRGKLGYKKITFCAAQAERDMLRYFWIDTCCIDKANNTELSRAINSMFRWYRKAARCYVYMSDIYAEDYELDTKPNELDWELAFRANRWFTRGWTLQELIAPASVEFFTAEGLRLGDKRSLEKQISEVTRIPISVLRGAPLAAYSVEERFDWAKSRRTTQEEDWAYSLLGIFGVFISLIYGEGKDNAVRRLKREFELLNIDKGEENSSQYVQLRDAVGRKYTIPWHVGSQWTAMEKVIIDAFKNIEELNKHVREGHYDLEDPDGHIIHQGFWNKLVRPGWQITMKILSSEKKTE